MFALGKKTVNRRKHEIVCTHIVHKEGSEGKTTEMRRSKGRCRKVNVGLM